MARQYAASVARDDLLYDKNGSSETGQSEQRLILLSDAFLQRLSDHDRHGHGTTARLLADLFVLARRDADADGYGSVRRVDARASTFRIVSHVTLPSEDKNLRRPRFHGF